MQPRMPNVTPLVGVLLVVLIAVSTDLRMRSHDLLVASRSDLSAAIRSAPDDAPTPHIVINVEPDEEVRSGELVSTFDPMRGVAPDAVIALVPPAESGRGGQAMRWCDSDCEPTRSPVTAGDRKFDSREGNGGDTSLDTPMPRSVQAGVFAPLAHPRLKGSEESL